MLDHSALLKSYADLASFVPGWIALSQWEEDMFEQAAPNLKLNGMPYSTYLDDPARAYFVHLKRWIRPGRHLCC